MTDLAVHDVHQTLGTVHILKGASFTAQRGQITALLGASGSGKTTLLRGIAGLERPQRGRIEIAGQTVLDTERGIVVPPERRGIGLVFQSYALWPHKTVEENTAYGLKLRGVPAAEQRARVTETLDRLGLGHLGERYPYQLSGGQQQRVAICRALVYRPTALLMDEPLSNLDAKLREEARYWIRKLILELEMCCVIVTHDQGEALAMSDNVILLQDGTILQEGSPQRIYSDPATLYAATFLGANNVLTGTIADGGATISGDSWSLHGVPRGGAEKATTGSGVIRVERVGVHDAPGANRLQMQVEGNVFLGDRWEYRLARDTLRIVAHGAMPLEGSEVWCELPAEGLWIFPDA
ncbi:MAG TPA: ABC transporter ATP-binding protein [Acetobacteraceae bacterium]|nr:ABC transporter ATP-binding protein [Acetobacteraceae bacterium]